MHSLRKLKFRRKFIKKKKGTFFSTLSQFSPILTALIAFAALWFGIVNVNKTLDSNRNLKAIDIYYDYTLRVEEENRKGCDYLDTAFTFNSANWADKNYQLFAHYVLFISESIYSLENESDAWRKTLYKYMLFPHVPYYEAMKLMDDALLQEFSMFYKDSVLNFYRNNSNLYKFLDLPDVRQATSYTCGTAAAQSILMYYGIDDSEEQLVKIFGTSEESGTSPEQIIHGFKEYGLVATVKKHTTLGDLSNNLKKGIPTLVAIQAWLDNYPPLDWTNTWDDGHWVIVVGMDNQKVYFEDPSILGSKGWLYHDEFIERWHDYVGETPCCDSLDRKYVQLSISVKGKPAIIEKSIHIN